MENNLRARITPLINEFLAAQYCIFGKFFQYSFDKDFGSYTDLEKGIWFYTRVDGTTEYIGKIALAEGYKYRLYQLQKDQLLSFNAETLRMLYRIIEMLDNEFENHQKIGETK